MSFIIKILNKIIAYDTIISGCNKLKIKGLSLDNQVDYCKQVLSKFKEEGIV